MYSKFEQLLQERGVTAYKVGKATGIVSSTFTDWKLGRSVPKTDKLKKIADYFGVPIQTPAVSSAPALLATDELLTFNQTFSLAETTHLNAVDQMGIDATGQLGLTDDDKTLIVAITVDGLTIQCTNPVTGFDTEWSTFTSGMDKVGTMLQDLFKKNGYDVDVTVIVRNDMNDENMLYMSTNTVVDYDIINDK